VFVAVADRRSFAAAARALNLSRSIATRYVSELESELGVQLLVRTTRLVAPTVAGQLYLERIRGVLDELDKANEFVRQHQEAIRGVLRLSAPLSLGLRFLPGAIARFRALHPHVDLKLNLTDRFVNLVSEGFDMALRVSGPPDLKSPIWRKICEAPRLLVASPAYLQRKGAPKSPADLSVHQCLGYTHFAGGDRWTLRHTSTGLTEAVRLSFGFECDNGDVVAEMAALGEGIALLPRFVVSKQLESGALSPVLPAWRPPEIWLTALFPPYEALPATVDAFTRFIERWIASDPSMIAGGDV
jgi:DNA-binding transcriptional LysR family regulator